MNFWDASALVALAVDETHSLMLRQVQDVEDSIAVWWGTPVEFASAMARREREGLLQSNEVSEMLAWLDAMAERWYEVQPDGRIRQLARRLLRVHTLRAADALQLAAAIAVAEDDPSRVGFVSFDSRLKLAASREGFVLPPEIVEGD